MRKSILLVGVVGCSMAALAGTALSAGRMQPGLWRISTIMDAGAMPQLTPQETAQMRAMGLQLPTPGQPMISEVCVTPEQAAMDTPPNIERTQSGCNPENVRIAGNRVTADIVCTGRIQGQGQLETTYSGMTHYQGSYRFAGTGAGRAQSTNITFSANFVSGSCGAVKPLQ